MTLFPSTKMSSTTTPPLLFLFIIATHVFVTESMSAIENVHIIDYWKEHIISNVSSTIPEFLLNKASPLTPFQIVAFSTLVGDHKALYTHLPDFCEKSNLLCSKLSSDFLNYTNDGPNLQHYPPNLARNQENGFLTTNDGPNLQHYPSNLSRNQENDFLNTNGGPNLQHYPPTSTNDQNVVIVEGKEVHQMALEPGSFFREEMLRTGNFMHMPDFRDKLPNRSFLPRAIVSKLPFSTSKLEDMKNVFHAGDGSAIEKMFSNALAECERAPSPGETKRCVASIEDMIDFSTSLLGRNVDVRSMESEGGYNSEIMIGEVKGISGGNVTTSVSCHQMLHPYMLYFCHSVPKVRVYEADILDLESQSKINHGVSVCHLDTSTWSPKHESFELLGSGPGKIEVCHWIYENDMTWTIEG